MIKWQSLEGSVKIMQKNIVDELRMTIELDDIFCEIWFNEHELYYFG